MDLTNEDVADILALLDSLPYDSLDVETPRFRLTLRRAAGGGWTEESQVLAEPALVTPAPNGSVGSSAGQCLIFRECPAGGPTGTGTRPASRPVPRPGRTGLAVVAAPLPGTFYRAPRPGADPFVGVGDAVGADTVVAIVETMKLMNSVHAGTAGRVARICVDNGEFAPLGSHADADRARRVNEQSARPGPAQAPLAVIRAARRPPQPRDPSASASCCYLLAVANRATAATGLRKIVDRCARYSAHTYPLSPPARLSAGTSCCYHSIGSGGVGGYRVLRRVLVANRGEIAVRVIRTCRRLGIETVLTVSDADAGSLPARLADQVIRIGPAPAPASYLNVDAVVGAAVAAGADAVHPGYGFLSENARLARACAAAGIVFIGPDAGDA